MTLAMAHTGFVKGFNSEMAVAIKAFHGGIELTKDSTRLLAHLQARTEYQDSLKADEVERYVRNHPVERYVRNHPVVMRVGTLSTCELSDGKFKLAVDALSTSATITVQEVICQYSYVSVVVKPDGSMRFYTTIGTGTSPSLQ